MPTRTFFAVVLAALVAAPSAAGAQTKRSTRTASRPAAEATSAPGDAMSVGGFVGYEWGDHISGFQLRADGELPFQQLSPQVKMSFVGSVGFTHSTYSPFGFDTTVNRLKLVPAARFTIPVNPQIGVYGDAGIGLHYTSLTVDFGQFGKTTDSGIGLLLRFGAGGFFQVNPRLRLLGELVLDPTFGTYHETSLALLVGLMYQL
jgi:hypothetical protein